jgi:putative nucleotidyltransferase with HDIG domain
VVNEFFPLQSDRSKYSVGRTSVAAGGFRVSKSKPEILEAVLATCVGVVIVDRAAGVGGLHHILLPEQASRDADFCPEIAASSGLPLFLDALRSEGCTPQNMETTIAGGALFGNLTPMDLDLDLGGRSVEVVNSILKEAGIRVANSETGGYFGYRLQLDLRSLQSEIEPLFLGAAAGIASPGRVSPVDLDSVIGRIQPIPQIALKIIREIQSEDYGLRDIGHEIRHDQVMTAKVLKVCNSPYVGSKEEIKSVEQAIVMLGSRFVGQLILSSAMGQFFSGCQRSYSMSKGGLYHHSICTGIVAEHLSRKTKKASPDVAYTAGLLHDIGKVLLDQYVASAMPRFYRALVEKGDNMLEAERSLLGITHAEAGARLAELWALPLPLRDAISYHCQPTRSEHDSALAHLIYLADLLVSRFFAGLDLDRIDTEQLDVTLQHLGLDVKSLPPLISQLPWTLLNTPGYF